jgi:hypothetical protein
MRFDLANLPTDTATLHRIIVAQAAESKLREAELAAAKAGLMAKALELATLAGVVVTASQPLRGVVAELLETHEKG